MIPSMMEVIKTNSDIVKDLFFKEMSRFKTRFAHGRSLERAARIARSTRTPFASRTAWNCAKNVMANLVKKFFHKLYHGAFFNVEVSSKMEFATNVFRAARCTQLVLGR